MAIDMDEAKQLMSELNADNEVDEAEHYEEEPEFYYGRDTYNAMNKFTDVVLRLAVVDDPDKVRPNAFKINFTSTDGVVNPATQKVCLRWLGMNGGVVNPGNDSSGSGTRESYNSEDGKFSEQVGVGSTRTAVPITHPFIWVSANNWCGFNHLPPIGAKVIVGFSKNNAPYILGYLNPKPKLCQPVIRPGETCIKGYGNNYILWHQSNKLDLHAYASEGMSDPDDPTHAKTAVGEADLWIRMDADNGYIKLSAGDTCLTIEPTGITCNVAKGGAGITINDDTVVLNGAKTSLNSQVTAINGEVHHNN
jgi:hypothetical protein